MEYGAWGPDAHGVEYGRDTNGVPLFIYARPEKTATETLTRFFGMAFNHTHKLASPLQQCLDEKRTMHCGVWTNVPALNDDRGEHRTRGHHTLDELCAVAAPLDCNRIVKFSVLRSPWERELSNWMWRGSSGHWVFHRKSGWTYDHGSDKDVQAFQQWARTERAAFLRPTSTYVAGTHAANFLLRFDRLQEDADRLLRDVLGVASPGRLPSTKMAHGDRTHAVGLERWFRGCCQCAERIGQWHRRDIELFNFTQPACSRL